MSKCGNPQCKGHAPNDPSIGQSPEHPFEVSGRITPFYVIVIVAFLVCVGMLEVAK